MDRVSRAKTQNSIFDYNLRLVYHGFGSSIHARRYQYGKRIVKKDRDMIRRIYSTLSTYKTMEFHKGLNVILAQKTPGSTELQTRNRAGKSSITEIIHFLMAGNIDKDSIFNEECLQEHYFGMSFDLGGNPITIQRKPSSRSTLHVVNGEYAHWPIQPSLDNKTGDLLISNSEWKYILGKIIFSLPTTEGGYCPTFRSLFSYFVRRVSNGGFLSPSRQSKMQQLADEQVNLSYLIGLDWTIPQQWQVVREQEKALKTLQKAAKEGALGDVISTTSELRTKLTVTESKAERLRMNLAAFKVLPEYQSLEKEASELTRDISQLNDENTMDWQLITDLQDSIKEETPPSERQVETVYRQAGIELPDTILKRFENVRAFHQSVVANRKSYLEGELSDAQQRIAERGRKIAQKEERRSELMGILQAYGALEHFSKIQSELTRVETEVENIKQRYSTAEKLETGKTDLDLQRQQLLRRLRQDHKEQGETLREAILAFEEISHAMYEEAGSLIISESTNGPKFDVKIQGQRSGGISNMQIFCFDMMLMKLCSRKGIGPGFLFHDSHLFDGVDERQVAKALQIAAKHAEDFDFQYIVTMNEDAVPSAMPDDFDFGKHVLPIRLTDATEDGGLFGMRFG
jgi:uncharacterized protein YydD (DUF2326 family)